MMRMFLIAAALLSITHAEAKENFRYHYGRLVDANGHVEGSNPKRTGKLCPAVIGGMMAARMVTVPCEYVTGDPNMDRGQALALDAARLREIQRHSTLPNDGFDK